MLTTHRLSGIFRQRNLRSPPERRERQHLSPNPNYTCQPSTRCSRSVRHVTSWTSLYQLNTGQKDRSNRKWFRSLTSMSPLRTSNNCSTTNEHPQLPRCRSNKCRRDTLHSPTWNRAKSQQWHRRPYTYQPGRLRNRRVRCGLKRSSRHR